MATVAANRYESPVAKGRARFVPSRVAVVLGVHLLAMLALVPALFSWTGLVLACAGYYVFGVMGINVGFHRLLSHRSFKCPKWVEHTLALLGVCCLQGAPGRWIALHRIHHQFSDQEEDPHTPLVSFLWAHFEWVMTEDTNRSWLLTYDKFAPDLMRDRLYLTLERKGLWLLVYAAHAVAFFAVGAAVGWLRPGGSLLAGLQFGTSLLVWGVFLRTVCVWHATWSVNSLTHLAGYRNYETTDGSRNNWFVSIVANGEGWHNNHHADQNCAAAGHRWWEFDTTFLVIRAMSLVGLASELVPPRSAAARSRGSAVAPARAVVHRDGTRVEIDAVETAESDLSTNADQAPQQPRRAA